MQFIISNDRFSLSCLFQYIIFAQLQELTG